MCRISGLVAARLLHVSVEMHRLQQIVRTVPLFYLEANGSSSAGSRIRLRPDPSDVPRTSGIETTRLEAHAASD